MPIVRVLAGVGVGAIWGGKVGQRVVGGVLGELLVSDRGMVYTPHEGLISTNQNDRQLDVYDRKLEGSHSTQGDRKSLF